jgi:hypothetical protein
VVPGTPVPGSAIADGMVFNAAQRVPKPPPQNQKKKKKRCQWPPVRGVAVGARDKSKNAKWYSGGLAALPHTPLQPICVVVDDNAHHLRVVTRYI